MVVDWAVEVRRLGGIRFRTGDVGSLPKPFVDTSQGARHMDAGSVHSELSDGGSEAFTQALRSFEPSRAMGAVCANR